MEIFGGEALIFMKFFRGRPIFPQGQVVQSWVKITQG